MIFSLTKFSFSHRMLSHHFRQLLLLLPIELKQKLNGDCNKKIFPPSILILTPITGSKGFWLGLSRLCLDDE